MMRAQQMQAGGHGGTADAGRWTWGHCRCRQVDMGALQMQAGGHGGTADAGRGKQEACSRQEELLAALPVLHRRKIVEVGLRAGQQALQWQAGQRQAGMQVANEGNTQHQSEGLSSEIKSSLEGSSAKKEEKTAPAKNRSRT
eukprot:1138572-Pelagomonas_calceolata.AAC.1